VQRELFGHIESDVEERVQIRKKPLAGNRDGADSRSSERWFGDHLVGPVRGRREDRSKGFVPFHHITQCGLERTRIQEAVQL
jgi:hypothetical protein